MSSLSPRSPVHTLRLATLAAGVALAVAFSPLAGVSPAFAQSSSPIAAALPSFAPLVKKVMPAVVNVSATLKPGAAAAEDADNGDQDQDQDQDQGPDAGPNRKASRNRLSTRCCAASSSSRAGRCRVSARMSAPSRSARASSSIRAAIIVTNNHVVSERRQGDGDLPGQQRASPRRSSAATPRPISRC